MDLSLAEEKLWACAERDEVADFRTDVERSKGADWRPTVEEAQEWGPDRTIRAEVIHELWRLGHAVRVVGCKFEGDISVNEAVEIAFSANGTLFTGSVSFTGVTFIGDATFIKAIFTEYAGFDRATFTASARFDGATFSATAWFDEATFVDRAVFDDATFTDYAWFTAATFTAYASFNVAVFSATASFTVATFTEYARFDRATFAGSVGLAGTWVRALDFTQARIVGGTEAVVTTGLRAGTIDLSGAVFETAVHLDLSASSIEAHRIRIPRYSQLRIRCETADFTDADLGEHTLLAGRPTPEGSATPVSPDERSHPDPDVQAKIDELDEHLLAVIPQTAALVSLERALVAGVTVSGLDLTRCQFHGAHGLDELRIDPGCTFASSRDALVTPASWLRPRLHTRRRIIADETLVPGLKRPDSVPSEHDPDAQPAEARTPGEVAETYRALRKSLEDAKNQPGASDFYYGEMQMRRRAHDRGLTEHVLVTAYWIVSGYGLRAGRALAVLVALIAIATAVFMHEPWATVTKSYYPADQPSAFEVRPKLGPERDLTGTGTVTIQEPDKRSLTFSEAAQFSLRESVALIRPASDNRFRPRGVGVVADIALRILGPLLIALALLAIRARTKR